MTCPNCSGMKLLNMTQASKLLGVSRWTLQDILKRGELKAVLGGGRFRRIAVSEILRWQRDHGIIGNEEYKTALDRRTKAQQARYAH